MVDRHPESDFKFYVYELTRAYKAKEIDRALKLADFLSNILTKVESPYFFRARKVTEILYSIWTENPEKFRKSPDELLEEFLSRHPHMRKWKSIKKSLPKENNFQIEEFEWWDQIQNFEYTEKFDSSRLFNLSKEARNRDHELVKREIDVRGIKRLIHYTAEENLPSIFSFGILSTKKISDRNIAFIKNDFQRFDNLPNWISTSLNQPNHANLYSIKARQNSRKFAVLEIVPQVLLKNDWLAFPTNAASQNSQQVLVSKPEQLMGINGLQNLFKDGYLRSDSQETLIEREVLGLSISETTDPQAEIMFHESIPPEAIQAIHTESSKEQLTELFDAKVIRQMVGVLSIGNWDFNCSHFFQNIPDYSWRSRRIDPLRLVD